ncbi:aminopeptidase N [Pseudoroseicyclus tamaricis]|uniref:Aminopeptidase N n=1 Tax=Pseudoroseicyclus tamaricis TaxID=2705421 RepID=A0A6B2JXQ4_9RHOB|nr:aminopeptidase N [Pseudoroseicyclus tamaricis]NDV00142.1 aminopeptidase N [Pseudoroseicyclus tamaricis]
MSDTETIHLADYTPPGWLVERTELTFRLHPTATRVISRLRFRRNPRAPEQAFFLHGEDLTLISARIDGQEITPEVTDKGLTCDVPAGDFTFEAEVEISPEDNTRLEGLYMSGGIYCTQCEAEGFRRITYYPDRPDVMAPFHVRVESDMPVLLSNGNKAGEGEGWAEWDDPWPKPAYLFALVAGDLKAHPGAFTTASGKDVELNIWVREADLGKCDFAMEALIKSMRWDEEKYGREYDLDIFNLVAVSDFNMGAMENKGLNIFNSKLVLASPETATDGTYERIEAVIAHEYFHNWTGNRITCRDWFQLSLKEGLTVFRDQQFTSDMRSAPVKRIEDAGLMRSHQFREDGGPLAHPVRPESFVEINNFYTVTVYEKGAEVIGMLHRLVGPEAYRKALDLYFERHDGEAATVEDWLRVFEDSTGRDLSQFKRWYSQAGTPRLNVEESFKDGTYTLTLEQQTPPTPGQERKLPFHMPVAVGLLSPNGDEAVPTQVLELTEPRQSFTFEGLGARPILSINRDFSAPVIVTRKTTAAEEAFLLASDTDPFNRWDAGRALARRTLQQMMHEGSSPSHVYLGAIGQVLAEHGLDPALRARLLGLPGEDELAADEAAAGRAADPARIHKARESLKDAVARMHVGALQRTYMEAQTEGPYAPDAEQSGKRLLANAALSLLSRGDGGDTAREQFARADNMTLSLGALQALLSIGSGEAELAAFEERWRGDELVMDMWMSQQVQLAAPERALEVTRRLTEHPAFNAKNPNRLRAVIGALPANAAGFHDASGEGYAFLADWLIRTDKVNPQIAARLSTAFQTWKRYGERRQEMIQAQLARVAEAEGLSRDLREMVVRMRAS